MQTSTFENDVFSTDCTMEFDTEDISNLQTNTADMYFETLDHVIIPIDDSDISTRALICTHNFTVGYVKQHIPGNNGGCTYNVYNGKNLRKNVDTS